jgi:hypothetical protein
MGTRVVIVVLGILLATMLLLDRSQRKRLERMPKGADSLPSLAADVESMKTALGTPAPGLEITAVEAAFRRYMDLESQPQLGGLYADDASIYYHREETGDERTGNQYFSGRQWKAFLNGTGPSPIAREEPEYSSWSDISYRVRDDGSVSVSATRHSSGYATPHKLIFSPLDGAWLITSEERTRLGRWRFQEPEQPVDQASD